MEALVEGGIARVLAGRVQPREIAIRLARALEDSAAAGEPATHYTVRLNPADARALDEAHPTLAETLGHELVTLAREAHLSLAHTPIVQLAVDPTQNPRTFAVAIAPHAPPKSITQTMPPVRRDDSPAPPRAFLIVDGQRTITVEQAVMTIGRRLENQLVINDPRVSRSHAQLRLRFGRHVIYDLGSTGGTFVNSRRIVECVLQPGDVISLGGVPIIYGEDGDLQEHEAREAQSLRGGSTHAAPPATGSQAQYDEDSLSDAAGHDE